MRLERCLEENTQVSINCLCKSELLALDDLTIPQLERSEPQTSCSNTWMVSQKKASWIDVKQALWLSGRMKEKLWKVNNKFELHAICHLLSKGIKPFIYKVIKLSNLISSQRWKEVLFWIISIKLGILQNN